MFVYAPVFFTYHITAFTGALSHRYDVFGFLQASPGGIGGNKCPKRDRSGAYYGYYYQKY